MANNLLETFLANLKSAVWDRETVTIGCGEFSYEELEQIRKEIENLQNIQINYMMALASLRACFNSAAGPLNLPTSDKAR